MKAVIFACMLGMAFSASAETVPWICIVETAGGVAYDASSEKWRGTSFRTGDRKYILKISSDGAMYRVREFGSDFPMADCPLDEGYYKYNWLKCVSVSRVFRLNTRTQRFSSFYHGGYELVGLEKFGQKEGFIGPADVDTPIIEVGPCTKL